MITEIMTKLTDEYRRLRDLKAVLPKEDWHRIHEAMTEIDMLIWKYEKEESN